MRRRIRGERREQQVGGADGEWSTAGRVRGNLIGRGSDADCESASVRFAPSSNRCMLDGATILRRLRS